MALSPVNRHLGLLGLLLPLLGCTDGVELLESNPALPGPSFALDSGAAGAAGSSGGTEGLDSGAARSGEAGRGAASASGGSGGEAGTGGTGAGGTGAGGVTLASGGTSDGGSTSESGGAGGAETGGSGGCPGSLPMCQQGWSAVYVTHGGCTGFVCAPPSECHSDADCGGGARVCYAGAACSDGCAADDPRCCEGNFCAGAGCDGATVPLTCSQRGCSLGQTCTGPDWTPPDCDCVQAAWVCTAAPAASGCS